MNFTRIVEDPGWARSDYYNIEAKIAGDRTVTYQEVKPAIQTLLCGLRLYPP